MPIVEPSPWRHQYFKDIACPDDVFVPADDPEAWAWNPAHRWVFDKLQLALSQNLVAGPHGLMPATFPVFSKPIFNFAGMGAGSRVLNTASEYQSHATPGHMWMPLLSGQHLSTDAAIIAGSVVWMRHATGRPTSGGMFDYWTIHAAPRPALEAALTPWITTRLRGYTGIINMETIGGTIIDAHLRFSDQWPDLYGPGWVAALVGLYGQGTWALDTADRRDGYSLALFKPHGRSYRHPPAGMVDEFAARAGISSIQITFYENRPPEAHSMPPGGFRLALVNAWDLAAGQSVRRELSAWFEQNAVVDGP